MSLIIAVTGTESTGKSEMCALLAAYFNTAYVPEQARIYLGQLGRKWKQADVLTIARMQLFAERQMVTDNNKILFCDTEMIAIKVWLKFYGYPCPAWLDAEIISAPHHHYLLMNLDLPWQQDVLRENPNDRQVLFNSFIAEMDYYRKPYTIISGVGDERFANALAVVKQLQLQ